MRQIVLDEQLQRAAHNFCRLRQKVRLHEATVSQHTPGAEHESRRHKTKDERRLSSAAVSEWRRVCFSVEPSLRSQWSNRRAVNAYAPEEHHVYSPKPSTICAPAERHVHSAVHFAPTEREPLFIRGL